MIDILVPVLGRPQNAQPLIDSITAATSVEHHVYFLCTPDDHDEIAACKATGASVLIMGWSAGKADYARKMNLGYEVTNGEFLFLAADDLDFQPGWDVKALCSMRGRSVVATNDEANSQVKRGQFGTHCLVRRSYIEVHGGAADSGALLHPGYDHNFVDRELCHVAECRRQYASARASVVRHRHPLWRTAPDDDTYRKALRNFRVDQRLFYSRAHLWDFVGLRPNEMRFTGRKPVRAR